MQYSKAKMKDIRPVMDKRWNMEGKIFQCKGRKKIANQARLERENNFKRKYLELIRYKKERRMRELANLKLEEAENGFDSEKFQRMVEILSNRIHTIVSREDTAPEVCKLFQKMMKYFREDANYFDFILVKLKTNCEDRSKYVSRLAELRRLELIEMDKLREIYRKWKTDLGWDLKEGDEDDLERLKRKGETLYFSCRAFMRAKALTVVFLPTEAEREEMHRMMTHIQEVMSAPPFRELFPLVGPMMLGQLQEAEALRAQRARR